MDSNGLKGRESLIWFRQAGLASEYVNVKACRLLSIGRPFETPGQLDHNPLILWILSKSDSYDYFTYWQTNATLSFVVS
jgi:hypothetical protein